MDIVTKIQILDEADCISHSTNILGKYPIILPPATALSAGAVEYTDCTSVER